MKLDLSGKTVLVTGGSRGIGAGIVRGLASAGARVIVHYAGRKDAAEALATEVGGGAFTLQADVGSTEDCARLWDEAVARSGGIDVLVNNAGIALSAPLEQPLSAWTDAWDRTMAVNLRAAGILCRAAIQHFTVRGGGRIINIASRAAFRGDQMDYVAYAASKGGMVALTRSIARGCGKQGIVAFTIAPGFVRTDMAQDFFDEYGEEVLTRDIALKELTEPKDVAPMVVLLATGLSDHATGATIDINAASYVH